MDDKSNERPIISMVLFYVMGIVANVILVSYRLESLVLDAVLTFLIAMSIYILARVVANWFYRLAGQKVVAHKANASLVFWILGCLVFGVITGLSLNFWMCAAVLVGVYFLAEFAFLRIFKL